MKTALITGANGGFGFLTCVALEKRGFHVIATMRDVTKAPIELKDSTKFTLFQLDITKENEINEVFQKVQSKFSKLDVLINNAGYCESGYVEESSFEDFKNQQETNVFGTFLVIKTFLPLLTHEAKTNIITIGSVCGFFGFPGFSAYTTSKFALEGMSESLRLELLPKNIFVSLVEPAAYQTKIWERGLSGIVPSETTSQSKGRLHAYASNMANAGGDPKEVAHLIGKIVEKRRPKFRYPIGKGAKLLRFVKKVYLGESWKRFSHKNYRKEGIFMARLIQILASYLRTKKMKKWTAEEKLTAYQEKKIKQHLTFLKKRSPYFNELLEKEGEMGIAQLEKLPLMDKTVMMAHFDAMNTKNIVKEHAFDLAFKCEETRDFSPKIGDVTVGLSSGTSGNRGLFLVSEKESNAWAGAILAKLLPGTILEKERISFFLRANSNLYESVKSDRISFAFFDLLEELDTHIEKLNEFQPTILAAPPSMMRMLAKELTKGRLNIKPKRIITMAEVLDPIDRKLIEESFEQHVFQVYQCTEGFLGSSCSEGTLHLNEDIVYIEKEFIDDEKTKFYPIITDFERKAQPIVRYKLNDILTIKKERCACGSPMTAIEQIEGRSDDIFYFIQEKTQKPVPVFPDFVRRSVIEASDTIEEYRVIQTSLDTLEIQIRTQNGKEEITQQAVLEKLQTFLKNKELELPTITFLPYENNEKLKKLKRIERKPFNVEAGMINA